MNHSINNNEIPPARIVMRQIQLTINESRCWLRRITRLVYPEIKKTISPLFSLQSQYLPARYQIQVNIETQPRYLEERIQKHRLH